MAKETFDSIREKGLLIYEFVRGSHSHGTATETSDIDTGGVYLAPAEQLLGLGLNYQEQIQDEKSDNVWFEFNKFMRLLLKSNPTVLEMLYIPDHCIRYEHPIMTYIKTFRDNFVTKDCFRAFGAYAKSQIQKARGYNKMCVKPIVERKQPLDFAYTFFRQGSTKINNWLEHRGLLQKYCGCVNIPNIETCIGLYYDWGNHFLNEGLTLEMLIKSAHGFITAEGTTANLGRQLHNCIETREELVKAGGITEFVDKEIEYLNKELSKLRLTNMVSFIKDFYGLEGNNQEEFHARLADWYERNSKPIGYHGIVGEDGKSHEIRLSSVSKDERPITYMFYDPDKFSSHCREYRQYQDWVKNRNEVRYESNAGKNYDAKNMSECFRMINMCIEIANGEGVKCDRSGIDREFLLDIKRHKYTYDELMEFLEEKTKLMDEAIANSKLPDSIDVDLANDILLNIRYSQLKDELADKSETQIL